jgi:phospholipase A1
MKLIGYVAVTLTALAFAVPASAATMEECVAREVLEGDPDRSAGTIKQLCRDRIGMMAAGAETGASDELTAVEIRGRAEGAVEGADYVLTAYHPSYIMATYDQAFDSADTPFAEINPDFEGFEKEEMKYQVSTKAIISRNLFGSNFSLFTAYTQTAWWQLFSDEGITSAPFREINHEPELFLRYYGGPDLPFGGRVVNWDLSLVHESNGRSEFLSRSWNRVMGRFTADYGDLALFGRLWYRLPEDRDKDGNPYEYRYLGYGDLRAVWAPNRNTFSLLVRPGTEKIGTELTWSYPISKNLRVYAQWWQGYGESLIAYDQRVNRFGIGVALNDYLMRNEPR